MRRVMVGDVLAAAQVLQGLPPAARPGCMVRLLERAHAADMWRKRLGRVHPCWGNGSLMACALVAGAGAAPAPRLNDAEFLSALAVVIAALQARRAA